MRTARRTWRRTGSSAARRLQVPVRVLGLLDAGVRVDEAPGPLLVVHERAGFGLAGGQLVGIQCVPTLACDRILARVVALLADTVERGRRMRCRTAGGRPSRSPGVMLPGNACGQVEHEPLDVIRRPHSPQPSQSASRRSCRPRERSPVLQLALEHRLDLLVEKCLPR